MTTHALAEVLERPQLQLLDRTFGAIERRRHFANALLLDEAHPHDLTLQLGQSIDVSIERETLLDVFDFPGVGHIRQRVRRLGTATSPVVGQCIRRDPEQPRRYWNTTPLELTDRPQRLLEHLGRDVLSIRPIGGPAAHERVDAIDVSVVELDEARRIGLRGLDQQPLIIHGVRHADPDISILVTGTHVESYGAAVGRPFRAAGGAGRAFSAARSNG